MLALPNQRRSLDFLQDQMAMGRRFRNLNIVDDVTRECLRAVLDTSISGRRVVRELGDLIAERRAPRMIVSDNGTEMTATAFGISVRTIRGLGRIGGGWRKGVCAAIAAIMPARNSIFVKATAGALRPQSKRWTCGTITSKTPCCTSNAFACFRLEATNSGIVMTSITVHTRIARAPDILPAEIDGELLLMSIEEGRYVGLAGTARQIWDLIEPPCTFGALCDGLRERYSATPGRIDADALTFVGKLAKQKLIILS